MCAAVQVMVYDQLSIHVMSVNLIFTPLLAPTPGGNLCCTMLHFVDQLAADCVCESAPLAASYQTCS